MERFADPSFTAIAIVATVLFGLVRGGLVGAGVMATALLSLKVPPQQAVAITLPIIITQDMLSVWVYRKTFDGWNLAVLTPGAILGTALAGLFASSLSPSAVRLLVGIIGLIFILVKVAGPALQVLMPRRNVLTGLIFGTMSGFTSMLANAGAPAYHMFVLPQRMEPQTLMGTTMVFFAVCNAVKVPAFLALGTLTSDILVVGFTLMPLGVASTLLGVWLGRRLTGPIFYKVVYTSMFLLSVELIRSGIAGLYAS